MRQEFAGAMLAGVLALAGVTLWAAPRSAACQVPAQPAKHVTPSSLAPGERAYKNLYGAPIPKPIVSKHVHHNKAKPQPQLHTSPLPAA